MTATSTRGDKRVRALLYEAAIVVLTRVRSASVLRRWGLKLKDRAGFKRAAVGLRAKAFRHHACDVAGWRGLRGDDHGRLIPSRISFGGRAMR